MESVYTSSVNYSPSEICLLQEYTFFMFYVLDLHISLPSSPAHHEDDDDEEIDQLEAKDLLSWTQSLPSDI